MDRIDAVLLSSPNDNNKQESIPVPSTLSLLELMRRYDEAVDLLSRSTTNDPTTTIQTLLLLCAILLQWNSDTTDCVSSSVLSPTQLGSIQATHEAAQTLARQYEAISLSNVQIAKRTATAVHWRRAKTATHYDNNNNNSDNNEEEEEDTIDVTDRAALAEEEAALWQMADTRLPDE